MGVGATFWFPGEAFLLKFPGLQHPFADGLRRFGAFFAAEFLIFDSGRLDVNVDPVEQWPGNPVAIIFDLFRRAAAFPLGIPKIPARVRIQAGAKPA